MFKKKIITVSVAANSHTNSKIRSNYHHIWLFIELNIFICTLHKYGIVAYAEGELRGYIAPP